MSMTPVVFLELAMPDVDLPSFDPFFLAIRLSKRLLNKIQAVEAIGRKHGLVLAVFETSAEDAELPGTLSEVSSIELHVADELVWYRVFGQRYEATGELGKIEPLAESWGIDVKTLARIHEQRTAVTLHTWPQWADADVESVPFGPRVLAVLRETASLPLYQRLEWFDPESDQLLAELEEPRLSRDELRRRRRFTMRAGV